MFCFECIHTNGLLNECEKGHIVEDNGQAYECNDYLLDPNAE